MELILFTLLFMSALSACSFRPASHSLHWSQLPPLPDALGVAGPFAGVSGETLLVAGGANFPGKMPWEGGKKVWHDDVYALAGVNSHWTRVGKLPRPLAYGISVTTKTGVVCIGGNDAGRHYRDVFRLSYRAGIFSVQPMPSLPLPLANAAGALVGSTIYVAGGSDQPGEHSALNQCFTLNLNEKFPAWQTIEPCPGKARILPVAAGVGKIFLSLRRGRAGTNQRQHCARLFARRLALRAGPRLATARRFAQALCGRPHAGAGCGWKFPARRRRRRFPRRLPAGGKTSRLCAGNARLQPEHRQLAHERRGARAPRHAAGGFLAKSLCHSQRRNAPRRPFAGNLDVQRQRSSIKKHAVRK